MTRLDVDACIVGGGPAGLMLGLLLAKRGADVLVLEGHENFDREFRGEVLQPSTVRLLDKLGLLEDILNEPHSLLEAGKIRIDGRMVGEFSFKRIAPEYPYAIWMPQPIFLAALQRKAAVLPTFKSWMGAKVSKLIQEDGRTVGVTGLRHGSEPFEIRADVVIGADGRYSAIAKLGGFTAEYEHHDFDMIWFTIPKPPGWHNTLLLSLGEVRGLMLPKYPNDIQAGIVLKRGEWKQWRAEGIAAVADRVRRFDPMFKEFADGLTDFTPFFPLDAFIKFIDDWARDGLLLIGDAAHTMSPAGAIGVNVAIATAVVAAQEIFPHLGRGPVPHAILRRVQALREADVRALHALQLRTQVVLVGAGGSNRLINWLTPKLFPVFLKSPLLPRVQRRVFFGAPLPPMDPAFRF